MSLRVLIAMASQQNWSVGTTDVKSASSRAQSLSTSPLRVRDVDVEEKDAAEINTSSRDVARGLELRFSWQEAR